MPARDITFRELFSPRVVYDYTIYEAWQATPRILLMIGIFLAVLVGAFLFKKLLEFIFFRRYLREKYMLKQSRTGQHEVTKTWTRAPTQHWASIGHLILETLFVAMVVFAAIFACAAGGIEFWTTAVGVGLLGVVLAYVFGPGLQQAGAAYFCYLMNSVAYDEWWEIGDAKGRVVRITPFFVELESEDPESHTASLHRVPMLTILNANMRRDYYKEANSPHVSFFKDDITGKGFLGPAKIISPTKHV